MARYFAVAHIIHTEVQDMFGDYAKSVVDFEADDYVDCGAKRKNLFRKTWDHAPSNVEINSWLAQCAGSQVPERHPSDCYRLVCKNKLSIHPAF